MTPPACLVEMRSCEKPALKEGAGNGLVAAILQLARGAHRQDEHERQNEDTNDDGCSHVILSWVRSGNSSPFPGQKSVQEPAHPPHPARGSPPGSTCAEPFGRPRAF